MSNDANSEPKKKAKYKYPSSGRLDQMRQEGFLRAPELSNIYDVAPQTVYRWMETNEIQEKRHGRHRYFNALEVMALFPGKETEIEEALARPRTGNASVHMTKIESAESSGAEDE
jgi:hypothetical protein